MGNEIDQIISDGDLGDMYATEVGPVAFVPAMRQDNQCLAAIQNRLIERGIPPGEQ